MVTTQRFTWSPGADGMGDGPRFGLYKVRWTRASGGQSATRLHFAEALRAVRAERQNGDRHHASRAPVPVGLRQWSGGAYSSLPPWRLPLLAAPAAEAAARLADWR